MLEVSSAGADRALKKPEHFAAFLGHEVEVRLYRPVEGRKDFRGRLLGCDAAGTVTIALADGTERAFSRKETALVRLYVSV